MRLLKLRLSMFKGLQSFEFEPGGESAVVYGANGTGKTTIADAVSWLLFDKDTQDKSPASFGIKTVDENGKPLSGEEHTVEALFELESGETVKLKKAYYEKWSNKRGLKETKLTHPTDYYWDDEPISKTEYKDRIENIMPEELFKMLTLPNYFAEVMHWSDRRKVLADLCGDVSMEDVLSRNPDLHKYPVILDGKSEEGMIKILRDRKKKLSDELDNIPSRIDENQQKIVVPEQGEKQVRDAIEILEENLEGKREKLNEVKSGGGVADLNVKVQQIEAEKAEAKNEHREQVEANLAYARKKVADLQDGVDQAEQERREAVREYKEAESQAAEAGRAVAGILEQIEREKERQPDPKPEEQDGPSVCPMCEQPMPESKDGHDDHYEKYVEEFNAKKAENLKEFDVMLKTAKAEVERSTTVLEEKEKHGAKISARLEQRKEALKKATEKLNAQKAEQPEFDSSEFDAKQKTLLDKVNEIKLSRQSEIDEANKQITELKEQIEKHQQVLRQHENNRQYQQRIAELKELLKKYGDELNEVEQQLNLIEDYNRAKAELITERVNELFDIVNWRLFKEQVNGGMTETADPVVGGVPYSEGLNNASRIQAGIDIIKTLSRYYGKSAPIWIDNRESCTSIPDNDLQVISLVVSPEDSVLRTEQESKLAVA